MIETVVTGWLIKTVIGSGIIGSGTIAVVAGAGSKGITSTIAAPLVKFATGTVSFVWKMTVTAVTFGTINKVMHFSERNKAKKDMEEVKAMFQEIIQQNKKN